MSASATPAAARPPPGAVEQAQRDVAVEAGGHDGYPHAGAVEHRWWCGVAANVPGHQVQPLASARCDVQGDPLDDLQAKAFEAAVAGRVVGHQPHVGDAEVGEDLGTDAVLPAVGRLRRVDGGIDGSGPVERVRHAEAATFPAAQVDQHAAALVGDAPHGCGEGAPATAVPEPKTSAREALAVHPHEGVVPRGDVAPDEGDVPAAIEH